MAIQTDDFERGDGGLGTNWENLSTPGGWGVMTILSGVVRHNTSGNNFAAARWSESVTNFNDNQFSQGTFVGFGNVGAAYGPSVLVRASADIDAGQDFYFLQVLDDAISGGVHTIRIGKKIDDQVTVLSTTTRTVTNSDVFKLSVIGVTPVLKAYQNGSKIDALDITDTVGTLLTTGQPGIGVQDGPDIASWEGGDEFVAIVHIVSGDIVGSGSSISSAVIRITPPIGHSTRVSTTSWLPSSVLIGDEGFGLLGSEIPGGGFLLDNITLPADANKEFAGRVVTWPTQGTLVVDEDSTFTFTGAVPGLYFFEYQLYVDGIATGTPITVNLAVSGASHPISGNIVAAAAEVTGNISRQAGAFRTPALSLATLFNVGSTTATPRITITFPGVTHSISGNIIGGAAVVDSSAALANITDPTWLQGVSINQWVEISGTNLSSVDPVPARLGVEGVSSKVTAWTSFVADERDGKVYCACNGGHNDYGGNEVDVINLSVNAPSWLEIEPSSANADINNDGTYYDDGKPSSRHTYYGVHLQETTNRIVLVGGAHYHVDGGFTNDVGVFNLVTNDYLPDGTIPDAPATSSSIAQCRDPVTDDIYCFGQWNILKLTRTTNTWSIPRDGSGLWGYESASAWDSTRNRFFILGGSNNERHTYTPADVLTQQTITGPAAAAVVNGAGNGMVYVPSLDAFLLRKGGAGSVVYRINAGTFEATELTTTGGSTVPATQNGPYNKFLYLPTVGVVAYFPTHTGNAWALRVE